MTEVVIAGRSASEILSMSRNQRAYWYRLISPEEKRAAIELVERARQAKMRTPERRAEISEAMRKRWKDPEFRAKTCASIKSTRHRRHTHRPRTGHSHTEKTKAKMRASWTPERRARISALIKELWKEPEFRAKAMAGMERCSENRKKGVIME